MRPAETDETEGTSPRSYGFNQRIALPLKTSSPRILRLAPLWEALRVALASLRSNKLRTALTLVGIIVGVSAVIAVVTIIKGLDKTVATTFSSQGSTVFTVSKRPRVITSREDFIKFNKRKDVTREDAEAIFRLCSSCWKSGIAVSSVEVVKHKDQKSDSVVVRGVAPTAMFDIDAVSIEAGRFWTESEGERAREICIVGADIVENLFGGITPDRVVGQESALPDALIRFSECASTLGKIFGNSRDNIIYIPYSTFQKSFGARDSPRCFVQTASADQLRKLKIKCVRSAQSSRPGLYGRRRRGVFSRIIGCIH